MSKDTAAEDMNGAIVREQDGEFSAQCKTCAWYGPEYKRKELAEESAQAHDRDAAKDHAAYIRSGHWYTR